MEIPLQFQTFPIFLSETPATKLETALTMHCHDKAFKQVTILDEAGETLFTVECKPYASWSWRRTVKDASGVHLFDLRKVSDGIARHKWIVESMNGRQLCSIHHASMTNRLILEMMVRNESTKGEEAMIRIRPLDQGGITTLVEIGGTTAAEIRIMENNFHSNGRDRSVWEARVAGGIDLKLVGLTRF